jgi:YfiH family protein
MDWRERSGIRWLEASLPGATAAFSTRPGGISQGPFASLNIGMRTRDERQRVRENRQLLAAALDLKPEQVLVGTQVHGAELAWLDRAPEPSPYADGLPAHDRVDSLATSTAGMAPLVQVADCLPIAIAGERGVAIAHGGWRGLAAGIIEETVEAVGGRAAAIGPGIGPCCYEVGDEVLAAFPELDGVDDGRTLDLAEIARGRLAAAGVEAVESADLCTSCHPELFFSHRRDRGNTGRQAGLVWINA